MSVALAASLLECLRAVKRARGARPAPIVLSSLPELELPWGGDAEFAFIHGPPGRNIALAIGLRAANAEVPLVLIMNADSVTLGTNHLIQAARRNVGMTLLLLRSELTRGAGPALDRMRWELPDYQRELESASRPLEWVSALEAALVGRATLAAPQAMAELLTQALDTQGFSVLGVTIDPTLPTGVLGRCAWPEYFETYRAWAKPLRVAAAQAGSPRAAARCTRSVPRFEVRIAGMGGHGVKLAGSVLSEAAGLLEGLWVTQRGDYGSATRGGPSSVDVVIGSEPITYPAADHPAVLVVLTQRAADRHARALAPGARVIADAHEVKSPPPGALQIPLCALAREHTGKPIAAGIVAIGCIAALTDAVPLASLQRMLGEHVPGPLLEPNSAACAAGFRATRAAIEGVALCQGS